MVTMTADMMLAALKKWGLQPNFLHTDWRSHNRNLVAGWGPNYGFVVHNFGSDTNDPDSMAYLYRGDPLPPPRGRNLPGPLSQFGIDDAGELWVIGWGAANHMGSIDPRLHELVKKDAVPLNSDFKPNVAFGDAGSLKGVADNYIGVEMTYGNRGATAKQRETLIRLGAAMIDGLGPGFTGQSVIGHREATLGRSDPTGQPMFRIRQDINALLKAGPSGPSPAKPPQEVPEVITPEDINKIRDAVWAKAPWPGKPGVPGSTAGNNLGFQSARADQTVTLLQQVLTKLTALEAVISKDPDAAAELAAFEAAAKRAFEDALKSTLTVTVEPAP